MQLEVVEDNTKGTALMAIFDRQEVQNQARF